MFRLLDNNTFSLVPIKIKIAKSKPSPLLDDYPKF